MPAALPPLPKGSGTNRLALAQWLVSGEHPLTARVWVNRAWEKFFGIGIVRTTENLGSQAEWPSHPELLDWLATEFMRDWDMKRMQKMIVMSAAYRQSSKVTPALLEKDPDNRLLARGLLSRAQYDAAQTLISSTAGKRIGELMIDAGLIHARELNEALCEHLLRMLDSMFLWQDGRWQFEADVVCTEPLVLTTPTAAIIMGGARHRIPLRRLWEAVGATDQRPLLPEANDPAACAALASELQLEPSEATWLPQFDGSRNLAAMLDDFDADEHELLSLIYTLKMIRRLELVVPEPKPFAAQR